MIMVELLGPVVVETDAGSQVPLSRPLELALMARLALSPGRPISTERLIDDLWGERLPAKPVASLQTLVYRLRRTLGPEAKLVSQHGNGYALMVPKDQVDIGRFERLVSQVRDSSVTVGPVERRVLLRRALAIWRGPPLAGLDSIPFVPIQVTRLASSRLAVLEERVDADLAAGCHAALVTELEELVCEYPFEERLWAQLMTALYRSGSQTASLRTCSKLRQLLGQQLGIEPSPMIQALERDILAQNPDLAWRPDATSQRPHHLVQVSTSSETGHVALPLGPRTGTNLPFSTNEFIGRAVELKEIDRLMAEHRLVSLVGPGGSGKTRLALEAARSRVDQAQEEIWFVDLTAVAGETGLVQAIASTLGISETAGLPFDQQLIHELGGRHLWFIFDNCEHLIDLVVPLLVSLLNRASGLRVLCTTREVLGVAGEAIIQVGALTLPSRDHADALLASDAVRLFVSRGRAGCPTFEASDDDLVRVAEICRLVDGLPLGIELAAARLRAVSVSELVGRLTDQLTFLGISDSGGDRHRTMEGVVGWSYDLLKSHERLLLRRLAPFAGGFTVAAAEDVCGWGDLRPKAVIELLSRLIDKSLVQRLEVAGGSRYRLLEIIRAFAAARLDETDEVDAARDRHLLWAMDLIGDLEAAMRTDGQDRALAKVTPEHDNLRVARDRAHERGDAVAALRITTSAPIDPNSSRAPVLARLLREATTAPLPLQARACYACVTVAFESGDYETGVQQARRAAAMFRQLVDPLQEAYSVLIGSFCRWGLGDVDVGAGLGRAAAMFDRLGDKMGRAYASWTLAQWRLEHRPDDPDIEALAIRGVELFEAVDAAFGLAHAREGLAYVRLRAGGRREALALIADAMVVFQTMRHLGCLAHTIDACACCIAEGGDLEEAARLVGAAEPMRERSGAVRRPWEVEPYARLLQRLSTEMSGDALGRARAEGRHWSPHDTVERVRQLVDAS